jgi:hypothetical protein
MHLNVEKPIVHYTLGAALILMVLLYAGLAPDVQKGTGQNWQKSAGFHYQHPPAHAEGSKEHPEGATSH